MGAKQQALKNAARRRAEQTGESYEAALKAVRAEYQQGRHLQDEDDEGRGPMGFDAAADPFEHRPQTAVTGYFVAWGVQELADTDQVQQLLEHAEKTGRPGSLDPLVCFLCDQPIDVTREKEVHVGLALQEVRRPGSTRATELQHSVWTHEGCGRTRVWSWSQLALERRRRGLDVRTEDLPPKQHRRRGGPVEDYYVFTVPENSPPLFYLQPGEQDRHGHLGFRADRLSDGLPAVDLTRGGLRHLPEWSIAADRTGLTHIERQGTGRWYQPPRPWSPPPAWMAAAHYHGTVLFLTAPARSIPPAQLEAGTGDLSALLEIGRQELLYGARMTITGL
ncbi:hypothetical protein ABTX81_30245 [Kitasatospora sp. NPDC097605]|uniref:hypothetical protein n=1 Tax=Kitasatospora sp. NPDC097605 TaxID=3157226 RepID=UPI0033293ECA